MNWGDIWVENDRLGCLSAMSLQNAGCEVSELWIGRPEKRFASKVNDSESLSFLSEVNHFLGRGLEFECNVTQILCRERLSY